MNIVVSAYRETDNIPLIALGLKETKEVDFSTPFKVQQFSFCSSDLVFMKSPMFKNRRKNQAKIYNFNVFIFVFVFYY